MLTNPQTWAAVKLTVTQALLVTAVNIVMGTLIAWVLVRDRFWGKRLLDLIIDVPFALPTIVAGLVLLSLYGPEARSASTSPTPAAVLLALAFVTLPFIVRTVQPVLAELEGDVEEAAASLGARRLTILRRIILPSIPRRSRPGRRSRSPARSRSTARWCCSRATCRSRPRSSRCGC